nr:zinc finger, PMZ-type [Tanacetum cinerariifolium]
MVYDQGNESSDAYCDSDDEDLDFMDFHIKGYDNVVIKTLTINDPIINKLYSNSGHFRGFIDEHVNGNVQTVDWNAIELVLGMRFEHPEQYKLCLANYEVANRQAILDSNPGFTCRLDDEETSFVNYYFRRIYVCFKGVGDGWIAGCKKTHESVNANVTTNLNDMGEIRFRLGDFEAKDNHILDLEKTVAAPSALVRPSVDKWNKVAKPGAKANTEPKAKKKGSKTKAPAATGQLSLRIYHKKGKIEDDL